MDEQKQNTEAYIEQFLSGELSDAEREVFEERLAEDEHLREELRLQQKARLVISTVGRETTRQEIAGIWAEIKEEQVHTRKFPFLRPVRVSYGIAAVLVLLIATVIIWRQVRPTPGENIYREMAQQKVDIVVRLRMGDNEPLFQNPAFVYAYRDYEDARYGAAARRFVEMLEQYPGRDTLQFMIGMSYLKGKEPEEAANSFESLLEQKGLDIELRPKVAWNLGLAYLRMGKLDAAAAQLEPFTRATNQQQATAATQALEQIKKTLKE